VGAESAGQINTAVAGIVLAAGAGSRFDPEGRRYKLTQPLPDGRTVLAAACAALLPHVDALDVVCAPERQAEIARALAGLAVRILPCDGAARGMGASLKHGVAASRPQAGWLVALGDMPFIEGEAIAAVAARIRAGAAIARARWQGQPGHPVGFSLACREDLLALDDAQGAAGLLRRRMADVSWVDAGHPGVLRDVDVPADLAWPAGPAGARR